MTYRVAAGVLAHLLSVAAGASHETLRGHLLKAGEQSRNASAADGPVNAVVTASGVTVNVVGLAGQTIACSGNLSPLLEA